MVFIWQSKWLVVFLATAFNGPLANAIGSDPQQRPIEIPFDTEPSDLTTSIRPRRVAVIGAGAAGSSTVYHLQQYAASSTVALDITLVESSHLIGGRTTTINALDDPRYPAELGASIFASVNHILVDAAKKFDLTTVDPDANRPRETKYDIGIWNGKEFVYKSKNGDLGWIDKAKLLWRYGLAPLKTQRLMKSTVAKFLEMYEEPAFPWRNLTEVAMKAGLLDATASTGEQFLRVNRVGEKFGREIIQSSTRVNYGQNLGLIHGLETMVCMATDGAMAVEGGNWRIFDGMVKESQAEVRLNTSVEEIVRLEDGGYELSLSGTETSLDDTALIREVFDTAVIAAPFQYSGIKISPTLNQPPDEIPYVTLYVTLLTSTHRLSPKFFSTNTSPSSDQDYDSVPEMVITTLPADLNLGSSPQGVGPTNFWSVSIIRAIEVNESTQYLYKIFSPEALTATFVSELLNFPFDPKDDACHNDSIRAVSKEHISWTYEKKWCSYPYEYPRLTFEELNLDGKGLWYTSGIESFISTMETSALMGKNVARLIVDELVEERNRR
jgi:prenylcysteine oxidase / farnesylcysteine lyase